MQRERVHRAPEGRRGFIADARQSVGRGRGRRQPALTVPGGHGGHAAHEVPEIVRQVDVVPLLEPRPREIAVAAERDFLYQVQPERVDAKLPPGLDRIDDIAERLAHPLAVN